MESIKDNRRVFTNDMDRGFCHNAVMLINYANRLLNSLRCNPHLKNSTKHRGKDTLMVQSKVQYQRMISICNPPAKNTERRLGNLNATINKFNLPSPVSDYNS